MFLTFLEVEIPRFKDWHLVREFLQHHNMAEGHMVKTAWGCGKLTSITHLPPDSNVTPFMLSTLKFPPLNTVVLTMVPASGVVCWGGRILTTATWC
jgi:hypothetical protein